MFDPVVSDPPLLLLFPTHFLIEQSLGAKLHILSLVCFFSWESACDQHIANMHCPDRGSGVMHPPRAERRLLLQALASARLDTDRSHKTALTSGEKRYLAVYIY
ncbi:unnamed protein product [Staurois parvus]|uniref:Uncharacterized protein n=1 Tax=Staurois parvus TaxID=386267 RepID=A0ABN9H9U6_9NEOB|nr:unnamed protein product [Staurois parvus]